MWVSANPLQDGRNRTACSLVCERYCSQVVPTFGGSHEGLGRPILQR
jgi:hypothetical protein